MGALSEGQIRASHVATGRIPSVWAETVVARDSPLRLNPRIALWTSVQVEDIELAAGPASMETPMEARIARLEADVAHLRTDVADIKVDVSRHFSPPDRFSD